jgi:hypothetical protein
MAGTQVTWRRSSLRSGRHDNASAATRSTCHPGTRAARIRDPGPRMHARNLQPWVPALRLSPSAGMTTSARTAQISLSPLAGRGLG